MMNTLIHKSAHLFLVAHASLLAFEKQCIQCNVRCNCFELNKSISVKRRRQPSAYWWYLCPQVNCLENFYERKFSILKICLWYWRISVYKLKRIEQKNLISKENSNQRSGQKNHPGLFFINKFDRQSKAHFKVYNM